MTIALDATALLARHISGSGHDVMLRAMSQDVNWCASALALTEAIVLAERLVGSATAARLRGALLEDWSHFAVVPVDQACLERAADLARDHPLRTIDAIHLAAADRLPRPIRFATLDAHQIPVADALGFEVISPSS